MLGGADTGAVESIEGRLDDFERFSLLKYESKNGHDEWDKRTFFDDTFQYLMQQRIFNLWFH